MMTQFIGIYVIMQWATFSIKMNPMQYKIHSIFYLTFRVNENA